MTEFINEGQIENVLKNPMNNARLVVPDRWMVWDDGNQEWVIYKHNGYKLEVVRHKDLVESIDELLIE